MSLLKILTCTLWFQDYFVRHLILRYQFRIAIRHVWTPRIHHIFGSFFIQKIVLFLFSLRYYFMSYWTQLCRISDNLAVGILFRLILAAIINYFIVRNRRMMLSLLINLDLFLLNGYLTFFDNTKMPFLVN